MLLKSTTQSNGFLQNLAEAHADLTSGRDPRASIGSCTGYVIRIAQTSVLKIP
jgi:hypothetical protein